MFGRKHYQKRSPNILFVIFRLLLSLVMFAVLLAGVYTAYKQFSGLDPLKLDPVAVLNSVLGGKIPPEAQQVLTSLKINQKAPPSTGNQVLGRQSNTQPASPVSAQSVSSNLAFRFLLVADSHSDNTNLNKAINQARQNYPDLRFIIGLGDYTDVGTIGELKNTKKELDSSGLRYFLIPGDHDLWDCRNRGLVPTACFDEVFGPNYQTFTFDNFKFLLLDNSDNYTGFSDGQLQWITQELEKGKQEGAKGIFVFLHEPLYHPSSDHTMGWVEKGLKTQAGGLIFELKDAGVTRVFTGDIHYFSQYSEPKTNIPMVTIGAITTNRNPQAPRFAVVSVLEDGNTKVEDIEIR